MFDNEKTPSLIYYTGLTGFRKYEKVASKVLDKCYLQDRERSKQLLIREMSEFGNTTLFCLAEENKLMDFMGRNCCQAKLEEIWKDVIPLSTSRKMVYLRIIFVCGGQ